MHGPNYISNFFFFFFFMPRVTSYNPRGRVLNVSQPSFTYFFFDYVGNSLLNSYLIVLSASIATVQLFSLLIKNVTYKECQCQICIL